MNKMDNKLNDVIVIKKDGTEEAFNGEKILIAVGKSAARIMYELTDAEKEAILTHVENGILEKNLKRVPIASMHSLVEAALSSVNEEVSKSYRDYRNYKKEFVHMMDDVYVKSQSIRYIGDKENANADSSLVATKRSLIFNELNKELYRKFFMTKDELQACKEGYIYVHDQSARLDTINCCLFNAKEVMAGGFEMGNVWYNEPKSLDTAWDVLGDLIISTAAQQYGGFTVPEVDKLMAPYAEKSFEKYRKEYLNLVKGVLAPEMLDDVQEKTKEYAMKKVKREMEQGYQGIEYKLNTVGSSRGDYPFITFTFGLGTGVFEKMCSITILNVHEKGQGKEGFHRPVLFPKLVFLYDKAIHGKGKGCEDVFEAGISCSANTMYPDWLSMSGKGYIAETYQKYREVISPMGCVDGQEVITYKLNGKPYVESFARMWERVTKVCPDQGQAGPDDRNRVVITKGNLDLQIYDTKEGFVEVENVIRNVQSDWRRVTLEHGRTLDVTADHPFETQRGIVQAKDLLDTDVIPIGSDVKPDAARNGRLRHLSRLLYIIHTMESDGSKNAKDLENGRRVFEIKVLGSRADHGYKERALQLMAFIQSLGMPVRLYRQEMGKATIAYTLQFSPSEELLESMGYNQKTDGEIQTDAIQAVSEAKVAETVAYTEKKYSYDVTTSSGHFEVSGVYSHNCRAFLSPWFRRGGMEPADENDTPVYVGRCNLGAVSLHLPMILAKARQESRDFYEVLDEYLELIRGLHKRTYDYIGELRASVNPVMFCEGGLLGGHLQPHDKIRELLPPMTMSYGITALNELQELYNGKSLVEDNAFALEVMEHINKKLAEYKKEDHILYAVYGTPAENLCFAGDTIVQVYGGDRKIMDVKKGDLVYSYNPDKGSIELKPVLEAKCTAKAAKTVKVVFGDGKELICTPNHPFAKRNPSNGFVYTQAKDLKPGDELKSSTHDGWLAVTEVKETDGLVPVYNIEVADNHNYFVGGASGVLVHNCGLQIKQFRKKYGIVHNVSDREYVSNSFHCHVSEDITPVRKQDREHDFWELFNGGKIQYVRYPLGYNKEAIRTLVTRAMDMGYYEGVNLALSYCDDCGYQAVDIGDECPVCGSKNLTKIDRMNGYLAYSRRKGDTRLNAAKMAEIADRKSM